MVLENYYDRDEADAVIGSKNSISEFNVDILEDSLEKALEGKIFSFEHKEEGKQKITLCQLEGLKSRNPWHETSVLKSVIKKKGTLKNLSGEADTKAATLQKMGVYVKKDGVYRPDRLNTPPLSGTLIYELTDDLLFDIVQDKQGLFCPGTIYGSDTRAPLQLKHFGETPEGFGEAHRIGVFGKSGSGKSVLAAQMLAGFARNKEMGILILDPQGEFKDDRFDEGNEDFEFSFHNMVNEVREDFYRMDLDGIKLEDRKTFVSLLKRQGILHMVNIGSEEYRNQIVEDVTQNMDRNRIDPKDMDLEQFRDMVASAADAVYTGDREERVIQGFQDFNERIRRLFNEIQDLFTETEGRRSIDQFIEAVLEEHKMVILDLSVEQVFSDLALGESEVKYVLLNGIIKRIKREVRREFRSGDRSNVLVALDEAHEYVPQGRVSNNDLSEVRDNLIELQKTSRKFGIGWMFINQRTADFNKDVYSQLEDYVYAWGLGVGSDESNVKDIVGKNMFRTYDNLPNPKQTGIFTYMVYGGIVGIGTQGMPLIIEGFSDSDKLHEINTFDTED